MVMPGDNTSLKVKLIQPIAMEKGLKFAIREGGGDRRPWLAGRRGVTWRDAMYFDGGAMDRAD
jgi:hypothetical protein